MDNQSLHKLRVKNIGIDTNLENIIYLHIDCQICQSEGFTALTRLVVNYNGKSIIASLNIVNTELIQLDEAGLSSEALIRLNVKEGDVINITHLNLTESMRHVRAKIYGLELDENSFFEIISDIVSGKYSNVELSAFVCSCAADNLSQNEMISLTKAMINTGQKINWHKEMVLDKHCAGGLPGNRTTPIVVSIIAAAGLMIPKTSSRAITSPAGTADVMAAMTCVDLSIEEMKKVVAQENGCFVGGGSMQMSPSDDIIISVEKALDIDSVGQMIASVLSKKAAAGSTHVIIDIPVGKTAKIRTNEEALKLKDHFVAVGFAIGLHVSVLITDGRQPVGKGIGPALEAIGVLSVLRNEINCPQDLKERSLVLAGELLNISGKFEAGKGNQIAKEILENGKALQKFLSICTAQGGFEEPKIGKFNYNVLSDKNGIIKEIDNRKLSRIAKLAGAPKSIGAGVLFNAPLDKKVTIGDLLFTIHAESKGKLEYAIDYLKSTRDIIQII